MLRPAELIDDERLIHTLLERDKPADSTLAADLDVDSIEEIPFITYRIFGEGQSGNGPGLWAATLTLNVYVESGDEWFDVCKHLYAKVHAWHVSEDGYVPGVGAVVGVEDIAKFSRVTAGVSMLGKFVTQYVGSFGLALRSPLS